MSHNDVVLYSIKNCIATIVLNRPESLNALNREVLEKLSAALEKAKKDQGGYYNRCRRKSFFCRC